MFVSNEQCLIKYPGLKEWFFTHNEAKSACFIGHKWVIPSCTRPNQLNCQWNSLNSSKFTSSSGLGSYFLPVSWTFLTSWGRRSCFSGQSRKNCPSHAHIGPQEKNKTKTGLYTDSALSRNVARLKKQNHIVPPPFQRVSYSQIYMKDGPYCANYYNYYCYY